MKACCEKSVVVKRERKSLQSSTMEIIVGGSKALLT